MRKVSENCDFCKKFKKAPLRPVVGFRMADKFNGVVCMDVRSIYIIRHGF